MNERDRLRREIVFEALQIARLECFGFYLGPNGTLVHPCRTDIDMYKREHERVLNQMAHNLLALLSVGGEVEEDKA